MRKTINGLSICICIILFLGNFLYGSSLCSYSDTTDDVLHGDTIAYYYASWDFVSAPYIDIVGLTINDQSLELFLDDMTGIDSTFNLGYMIYLNQSNSNYTYAYILYQAGVWYCQILATPSTVEFPIPTITVNSIQINTTLITFFCPDEDKIMIQAYRYVTNDPIDVYIDFYPNNLFEESDPTDDTDGLGDEWFDIPFTIWIWWLLIPVFVLVGLGIMFMIYRQSCSYGKNAKLDRCRSKYK